MNIIVYKYLDEIFRIDYKNESNLFKKITFNFIIDYFSLI